MIWEAARRFKRFLQRQERNFHVLLVRGGLSSFQQGLVQNYTSIYTVELGANPVQLGALRGVGSLVNAFLSAPLGWLADRYSLKRVLLLGLVLEALVPLGYALAQSWQALVIPVIFYQMTMVTSWTFERVMVANALRDMDRATGFGVFATISQVPLIVAPALAGLIVTWLGGISAESIRPLFMMSFGISILSIIWACWQLSEVKVRPELGLVDGGFLEGFRRILAGGGEMRRWLLIELLGSFEFGSTMPFIMVYATEVRGADAMTIGLMGSAMTVASILSSIPIGRLADKIGRKRVIFLVRPTLYISYLLLLWAPTPEILILAYAVFGVFWGCTNVWMAMRMEMVPIHQRGRWSGVINTLRSIIRVPAPILGGLLWERLHPSTPFLLHILLDAGLRMPLLFTVPETLALSAESTVGRD